MVVASDDVGKVDQPVFQFCIDGSLTLCFLNGMCSVYQIRCSLSDWIMTCRCEISRGNFSGAPSSALLSPRVDTPQRIKASGPAATSVADPT